MKIIAIAPLLLLGGLLAALFSPSAYAQDDCGGLYVVKRGDWLSRIAHRHYGDFQKWSAVHTLNIDTIGGNADLIKPGQELELPCIDGRPRGLAPVAVRGGEEEFVPSPPQVGGFANVRLLTGGDYAPFTDEDADDRGMLYVVVDRAMSALERTDAVGDYTIVFVNDWGAHLRDLLVGGAFDIGFPWLRPDCENAPEYRCNNFLFSEPMFEMLIVLFVDNDRAFGFGSDSDIEGKTLCRPSGYFTHDLEKGGRMWLTRGVITLEQPDTVAECFRMLTAGDVDAVAINEFTGRGAVNDLNLGDEVRLLDRPLSIEGLHALVPKNHDRAAELIEVFNSGLEGLRDSGQYRTIVREALERFWNEQEPS